MSIVLTWERQSRTVDVDVGRWTGSETWKVHDTTHQVITAYNIYSDLVANAGTYAVWGGESGIPVMRWTGETITPDDAALAKVWTVTIKYASPTADSGSTGSPVDLKRETEVGFTCIETDETYRLADAWRLQNGSGGTALTFPTSGNAPGLTTSVGGDYYDSCGDPITKIVPQISITVRNVIVGRPNYTAYKNLIGYRNSATFDFGGSFSSALGIGTTVFIGSNTARIAPNTYSVTWKFLWDEWYHLVQVAAMDPLTRRPIPDTSHDNSAKNVYWRQPFWQTGAFSGLGMNFT